MSARAAIGLPAVRARAHPSAAPLLLLAYLAAPGCAEVTVEGDRFGSRDAGLDGWTGSGGQLPRAVSDPFAGSCAHTTIRARSLPLDLLFMVDSSGSMLDRTGTGETKWDAVRSAFDAFFRSPGSDLGAGLQFFPRSNPGAPRDCVADVACGAFGPCARFRACTGSGRACSRDAECAGAGTCALIGRCSASDQLCVPAGATCGAAQDLCRELPGRCAQYESCAAEDYARPAVPIAPLPGAAAALRATLTATRPEGSTPTGPALTGAHQYARTHGLANPGKRVAVVLATDGFPTSCSPRSTPELSTLATAALAGSPSVPTFAIGVFTPDEAAAARANLDALARAGGTSRALLVDASGNVEAAFARALASVRAAALSCEYLLPTDPSGRADYTQLNLRYTNSRMVSAFLGHVRDAAACDPQRGGWYYDASPDAGAEAPALVRTCPATCDMLRGDPGGRIDLIFGCKTIEID